MSITLDINSFASAAHYIFTRRTARSTTAAHTVREHIQEHASPEESLPTSCNELVPGQNPNITARPKSVWKLPTSQSQISLHIIEALQKHSKKATEKLGKGSYTVVPVQNERASLVTKEMFNVEIDLDHDSDRKVKMYNCLYLLVDRHQYIEKETKFEVKGRDHVYPESFQTCQFLYTDGKRVR